MKLDWKQAEFKCRKQAKSEYYNSITRKSGIVHKDKAMRQLEDLFLLQWLVWAAFRKDFFKPYQFWLKLEWIWKTFLHCCYIIQKLLILVISEILHNSGCNFKNLFINEKRFKIIRMKTAGFAFIMQNLLLYSYFYLINQ